MLVCQVIRDLDQYCFAIHSIVVSNRLVELFESLCISYVIMNKTFLNQFWWSEYLFPPNNVLNFKVNLHCPK